MARKVSIAQSVTRAVTDPGEQARGSSFYRRLQALLTIYSVGLHQHTPNLFPQIRVRWNINAELYVESFQPRDDDSYQKALQSKGDMGYSGSTFFTTSDAKYLVKSLPRHFEFSFFRDDFLHPYIDYMSGNLSSLLIRITDFLAIDEVFKSSIGVLFGLAPSHHVIMENLLIGREGGENTAKWSWKASDGSQNKEPWKWETWDLKPSTYFFPERDMAYGTFSSKAAKSKLADEFDGKLVLTQSQADALLSQLERDTRLLEQSNVVDYSLFLIRIPVPPNQQEPISDNEVNENPFSDNAASCDNNPSTSTEPQSPPPAVPAPTDPPFTPPDPPSWRTGIKSADGKFVYRAAILDFFWAKHKARARAMTHLISLWNKVDVEGDKGPMSITTDSSEYRERFAKMCHNFIEVKHSQNK